MYNQFRDGVHELQPWDRAIEALTPHQKVVLQHQLDQLADGRLVFEGFSQDGKAALYKGAGGAVQIKVMFTDSGNPVIHHTVKEHLYAEDSFSRASVSENLLSEPLQPSKEVHFSAVSGDVGLYNREDQSTIIFGNGSFFQGGGLESTAKVEGSVGSNGIQVEGDALEIGIQGKFGLPLYTNLDPEGKLSMHQLFVGTELTAGIGAGEVKISPTGTVKVELPKLGFTPGIAVEVGREEMDRNCFVNSSDGLDLLIEGAEHRVRELQQATLTTSYWSGKTFWPGGSAVERSKGLSLYREQLAQAKDTAEEAIQAKRALVSVKLDKSFLEMVGIDPSALVCPTTPLIYDANITLEEAFAKGYSVSECLEAGVPIGAFRELGVPLPHETLKDFVGTTLDAKTDPSTLRNSNIPQEEIQLFEHLKMEDASNSMFNRMYNGSLNKQHPAALVAMQNQKSQSYRLRQPFAEVDFEMQLGQIEAAIREIHLNLDM